MSSGETADEAAKRQRVSRACDLCRRKKIKCDGLSPVCSNCQAFTLECSYNDTTKKRGPPKGYIEAIENRLHKLEQILSDLAENTEDPRSQAVLAELHQPLETATGEHISTRPVRRGRGSNKNRAFFWQSNTAGSGSSNKKSKKRTHTSPPGSPASSPQLMESPTLGHAELSPNSHTGSVAAATTTGAADDSNGQLSMDETGQVRYLGKSSGFYLLQNSRTYQNGAFHLTNCGHTKTAFNSKRSTPLDKFELPPRDLSMHLIRTYFTHYYPVLPLFYKRLLHSSVDPPSDNISPLLLNAIYAVASRISPDVRVRSDPNSPDTAGDIYFERAKCLLDDYYDTPKISTVQALLLMAMHQHGAMNSPRAWLYSGLAFRMAQDLGLHRNCDHWNIPPDERERRKRVFWCCFIVDRLFSALFGRASVFEERDCDVPFPSVDDDQEIEANISSNSSNIGRPPVRLLESFIQLIKICDILGHVLKNIYYAKARHHAGTQHIDHVLSALNQQLTNWFNSMPPSLQYDMPIGNGEGCFDPPSPVSQLHLIYYSTVILLHRPFIPGGPSQPPSSSSSSSSSLPSYNICMSAANSILDIVSIMLSENNLKYVSNFTVYYIFTAGIIFMKSATAAADSEKSFESKVKINKIMRALDEIELTWNTASRSCNILGELAGLRDINLECDRRENASVPQQQLQQQQPVPPSNSDRMQASPLSMAFSSPNAPNKERLEASLQQQQQQSMGSSSNNSGWMNNNRLPPTPLSRPPELLGNNNNSSGNNNAYSFSTPWLNVSNTYESTAPTVDPFAAPGTIPGPAQQQFDPLGAAFWGVPPSMDMNEWNNYLGAAQMNSTDYNNNNNNNTAFPQPVANTTTTEGQQPLIPSHEFAPVQPQARLPSSLQSQQQQQQQQPQQQQQQSPMQERLSINKHLIHTDDTVDVLSGVSNLTPPPRELALLNYLGATPDPAGPNGYSMGLAGTGHTTATSSTTSSSSSRQQQQQQQQQNGDSGSSSSRDPSGLMYW
ncbi:fungal-specific transcription factor domain-containing protein [Zychaea mexicana]|uniref:fungal-specific transcription factor domain-containing protein n=1 Tax=Zychaea mexicana TaxID=64656 RepID=UPI0022FDF547|nr:fungal-specific transcription factor domain-containing protein [Zychaea mexicana]KAI9495479.1 fungal-specific transcription factor domain-containing protein [Zychaea mexicana]